MPGPLNPTRKKHRFGKAWMHDHANDPYVQEAKRRGYRSRAAFKLIELDERDRLLRPGIVAVDLGAAPGSWCQVLRERLGPKATIVAIDALPMHPVAGVAFVQADFATDEGLAAVEAALGGKPVAPYFGVMRTIFTQPDTLVGLGYPLPIVYLLWIVALALLYPACAWWGRVKQRRREWWMSYL